MLYIYIYICIYKYIYIYIYVDGCITPCHSIFLPWVPGVSPGACNQTVVSALAQAKKLGSIKKKTSISQSPYAGSQV